MASTELVLFSFQENEYCTARSESYKPAASISTYFWGAAQNKE